MSRTMAGDPRQEVWSGCRAPRQGPQLTASPGHAQLPPGGMPSTRREACPASVRLAQWSGRRVRRPARGRRGGAGANAGYTSAGAPAPELSRRPSICTSRCNAPGCTHGCLHSCVQRGTGSCSEAPTGGVNPLFAITGVSPGQTSWASRFRAPTPLSAVVGERCRPFRRRAGGQDRSSATASNSSTAVHRWDRRWDRRTDACGGSSWGSSSGRRWGRRWDAPEEPAGCQRRSGPVGRPCARADISSAAVADEGDVLRGSRWAPRRGLGVCGGTWGSAALLPIGHQEGVQHDGPGPVEQTGPGCFV